MTTRMSVCDDVALYDIGMEDQSQSEPPASASAPQVESFLRAKSCFGYLRLGVS